MTLLFGLLIVLLILSVPVGVSIAVASLSTALSTGTMDIQFVIRSMITAYDSFPLLAVPLFILAGEIMSRGGISERLFDLARLFLGRFTGGIPMAVVGACLLFGSLSGSGVADTAAIGSIMIPAMIRMGYNPAFSAAIVAAAGGMAIIMPPSLPLIIYGISGSVSIGKLFIGGILPAILIAGLLMLYCHIYCRIKGYTNERMQMPQSKGAAEVIKRSILAILMPVIILGGIYGGVFTPTEAAAVAVIYSLIIGLFIIRTIRFRELFSIFKDAAIMIGPIMIILGGATVFSRLLVTMHIPETIAQTILSISDSPFVFLLIVNILLLIVGVFMETLSSIIILTPILLPVAVQFGIDPVHFGLIMVVNLAIGCITPPMAVNLFVVSSISKLSIEQLTRAILIPMCVMLVGLMLITYIPWFTLALNQ